MASTKNCTTLRLLHYPSISEDSIIKPGQIRCGEHTDYGSITLLFQDDMPGLEVNVNVFSFVSSRVTPPPPPQRGLESSEFLVGCAAGPSNPDPISHQNMLFPTPFFRPGL